MKPTHIKIHGKWPKCTKSKFHSLKYMNNGVRNKTNQLFKKSTQEARK